MAIKEEHSSSSNIINNNNNNNNNNVNVIAVSSPSFSSSSLAFAAHTSNPGMYPYRAPSDAAASASRGAYRVSGTVLHPEGGGTSKRYYACLVPKAGCSSWLSYLRHMHLPHGLATEIDRRAPYSKARHTEYGLDYLDPWGPLRRQGIESVVNDPSVFKFAVARHPWHRVISAYRSKYEGMCNFDPDCLTRQFGLDVSGGGGDGGGESGGDGHGHNKFSFHDFVRALARAPAHALDKHFRPVHLLCELPAHPYDALVDLSNATQVDAIAANVGFRATFSEFEADKRAAYDSQSYYHGRTHRVHNCTEETVRLAEQVYAGDAALLGYSFDGPRMWCRTRGRSAPAEEDEDE
eukprot:UC1_evm3s1979